MSRYVMCLIILCLLSTFAVQVQTDDEALALARQLIAHMQAGEFEAAVAMFDTAMTDAMPVDALQELWDTTLPQQVGAYQSELAASVSEVSGFKLVTLTLAFEKLALDTKVSVNADGQIAGLFFQPNFNPPGAEQPALPDYIQPDSFTETEVTVGAGSEWELPGTLTMPNGAGSFPAVVLVHGSGPNDRDESIGPNKPFRDLAQGLASKGIAVLRYDKRTQVYGIKSLVDGLTVHHETIEDALAAVTLLRETEGIDPERIFVLGHSLGGLVAPRIAAGDDAIAGIIVAEGALSSELTDTMLRQTEYLVNLDGEVSADEQKALDEIRAGVEAVRALTPDSDPNEQILNAPVSYWLDLREYDPVGTALSIETPMLIIQGERDYQVTMDDFSLWQSGLVEREDTTFKTYPALNHLMIAGEGQPSPEEYMTPGNVAPEVIEDIAAWILAQ